MSVRRVGEPKVAPRAVDAVPAKKVETQVSVATQAAATVPATVSNKLTGGPVGHTVLPSITFGEPNPNAVRVGPMSLRSAAAQDAITRSVAKLTGERADGVTYTARQVDRDSLGMTHVRMDREYKGLKVFGEQTISHLDANGEVVLVNGDEGKIPDSVTKAPKLTEAQATELATKAFTGTPDKAAKVESVIVKNADGKYVRAYHVELECLTDGDPRRMNYLIDANTGKSIDTWNQIDAFFKPEDFARAEAAKKAAASAEPVPVEVTGTATPNAPIADLSTVTSKITLDGDFPLESLELDLDISHTWRGDLEITLTSPSGKTVPVLARKAGDYGDDVKGAFDLSAFAGEPVKGEWTLSVSDKARRDTGTLNGWTLKGKGKQTPPPPPPPPPGEVADDHTMYSGNVAIGATQNADGTYTLADAGRGQGVLTKDANNKSTASGATDIKDNNNVWGEAGDPSRAQAGVDAQYGGQMTYDFYKNILGRDSIDGKGEALRSNVHIKQNYVNAYWDGTQMNYGDGDGVNASVLTALDIAGHEITHGMTERTAGLIYRGESGGLNEAMSDIFGKGVEWYASQQNPNVKFTWGVGESVWTPGTEGDALRYMNDPTKDGYSVDNYKNYPKQTEVHGSSGIANNAFYLLTQGGTNRTSGIEVKDGIGMEAGLKIYYRALSTYMTPSTTFKQAREATIRAATDLYGADSVQVAKVKESWTAVGVN